MDKQWKKKKKKQFIWIWATGQKNEKQSPSLSGMYLEEREKKQKISISQESNQQLKFFQIGNCHTSPKFVCVHAHVCSEHIRIVTSQTISHKFIYDKNSILN